MTQNLEITPQSADYPKITPVDASEPSDPCDCGGRGLIEAADDKLICQWCGKTRFRRIGAGVITVQPRNVTP